VIDRPQRGYGAALRAGIMCARGEFVVMGDGTTATILAKSLSSSPNTRRFRYVMGNVFGEIKRRHRRRLNKYFGQIPVDGCLMFFSFGRR